MSFVPGVSSAAPDGFLYEFVGQGLCVTRVGDLVTIPRAAVRSDDWLYLGSHDDVACYAHELDEPRPGTEAISLRQLFGIIPDIEFAIAMRGLGVLTWDSTHRYCGRCGAPTARSSQERVRSCSGCGLAAYPRLSPAVITCVERDGRILLARNLRSPFRFHSVLAGFVEVGETLEDCVHREISEEVGIAVTDVRYFGSQPWPLTSSLMVAFTARWASGELRPDGTEIGEADWFAPEALPTVPPRLSIARVLIDDFVARWAVPR